MLKKVKGNTYIVDLHGTCTGVYMLDAGSVILIDSGRYPAPEFLQWLNRQRLKVVAIIHTHLHIDHVANTEAVVNKYGAEVFASVKEPRYEMEWDEYVSCDVTENEIDAPICICGRKFETVFTPGHSEGHQMIVTPDSVCFVGDAILTSDILDISKLPYMWDIRKSLRSMERIKATDFDYYVASHYGLVNRSEIKALTDENMRKHVELFDAMIKSAGKPATVDVLVEKFLVDVGIESEEKRNYQWVQDTAKQRIDELIDEGILKLNKAHQIEREV